MRVRVLVPLVRLAVAEQNDARRNLGHRLEVEDARVRAVLAVGATLKLGVLEVRVHVRVLVKEPGLDVLAHTLRVDARARDAPRERVEEDGVGHLVEILNIVDVTRGGVQLAVNVHKVALLELLLERELGRVADVGAVGPDAEECQ